MVLLDSLLAFALTLAVLATVVTLLLETGIRISGLKRQGQVDLISRLIEDRAQEFIPDANERWQAVKAILENPFAKNKMAAKASEQKYFGAQANGIYSEVSLEHVLRRLTDSSAAAALINKTEKELRAELQAIARKYDEFSSALSADFKRRAQLWSIAIGVVLAFTMNVDGLRVLEAYLQDPALRQSVIEKIEIPEASEVQTAAQALQNDTDAKAEIEAINAKIGEIKTQLDGIGDLGLPIGLAYFPHCAVLSMEDRQASPDPLCRTGGPGNGFVAFFAWLLKVFVTGLLIGLGAPFWYDVARRLAAVRTAFGGKGSGEERHSGSDAKSESKERDDLIRRIVEDAKAAAA